MPGDGRGDLRERSAVRAVEVLEVERLAPVVAEPDDQLGLDQVPDDPEDHRADRHPPVDPVVAAPVHDE